MTGRSALTKYAHKEDFEVVCVEGLLNQERRSLPAVFSAQRAVARTLDLSCQTRVSRSHIEYQLATPLTASTRCWFTSGLCRDLALYQLRLCRGSLLEATSGDLVETRGCARTDQHNIHHVARDAGSSERSRGHHHRRASRGAIHTLLRVAL